jgi:hypothetical protein
MFCEMMTEDVIEFLKRVAVGAPITLCCRKEIGFPSARPVVVRHRDIVPGYPSTLRSIGLASGEEISFGQCPTRAMVGGSNIVGVY